jgi:hypothetical protein
MAFRRWALPTVRNSPEVSGSSARRRGARARPRVLLADDRSVLNHMIKQSQSRPRAWRATSTPPWPLLGLNIMVRIQSATNRGGIPSSVRRDFSSHQPGPRTGNRRWGGREIHGENGITVASFCAMSREYHENTKTQLALAATERASVGPRGDTTNIRFTYKMTDASLRSSRPLSGCVPPAARPLMTCAPTWALILTKNS